MEKQRKRPIYMGRNKLSDGIALRGIDWRRNSLAELGVVKAKHSNGMACMASARQ